MREREGQKNPCCYHHLMMINVCVFEYVYICVCVCACESKCEIMRVCVFMCNICLADFVHRNNVIFCKDKDDRNQIIFVVMLELKTSLVLMLIKVIE